MNDNLNETMRELVALFGYKELQADACPVAFFEVVIKEIKELRKWKADRQQEDRITVANISRRIVI